ncbi:MAG: prolyl oligopeptidase family serine peptidase, partial [Acidobacteriota bacterium]
MRRLHSLFVLVVCLGALAQPTYQKPPKEVLDVLHAPAPPQVSVSPAHDHMLLLEWLRYPPVSDLAQPMLRLAGSRINPNTNGPHRPFYFVSLVLKRIADGVESRIVLPPNPKIGFPQWSPDGKHFAFTHTTASGIELWVAETATAKARKLPGFTVNAADSDPIDWMPGNRTLLVRLIPAGRGKPPAAPAAPPGPNVQESSGKGAPVWTFQDLLKTPHDEKLYEYYFTAQLVLVDIASGKAAPLGKPAIFQTAQPSPDGRHFLVARAHPPYSYLYPDRSFPKEVEVWDRAARVVYKLASLPLADAVPTDGVPTGPRQYNWRPTEPATLVWIEALDGGDPKKKVPHRDRVLMLKAPFAGAPLELIKTEHRGMSPQWTEKGSLALVADLERERRWLRAFLVNADRPSEAPRLIWSRDMRDRYKNPGVPISRTLPSGHRAIQQNGDSIYLSGQGASPQGDRPFLDRLNLNTLQSERLFRCDEKSYESVEVLLDDAAGRLLTRRESPSEPPNYHVRTLGASASLKAVTQFPDPAPQLRQIKKQLVTYKRPDGVQLSFTLCLPPGYKEGTRLPTIIWAYPLEYNDPTTAGQVVGSPQRFTTLGGASHLFLLLQGYAILDDATMPVVGDFRTVNDTYVEQIVASAKAAIDKAAEMGVTDPARVGVSGHSYGGFMTANLLAQSDLFRAGVARSGAYNRTLTPFGFQSERRTFWEAPDLYMKVSPFVHAHKINEPILLIHGEADNNSGTFPIQSDRMYQAIRGNGGTVRLVMLPHESHGYAARESIEHVLYETIAWFDKYVK